MNAKILINGRVYRFDWQKPSLITNIAHHLFCCWQRITLTTEYLIVFIECYQRFCLLYRDFNLRFSLFTFKRDFPSVKCVLLFTMNRPLYYLSVMEWSKTDVSTALYQFLRLFLNCTQWNHCNSNCTGRSLVKLEENLNSRVFYRNSSA